MANKVLSREYPDEREVKDDERHSHAWLSDECNLAVLRALNTVVFLYDPISKEEHVSPLAGEYLAGNYDGRKLSDVMLADGVIHPDDLQVSLRFREQALAACAGNMTVRLKTPSGDFHWFELSVRPCESSECIVGILRDVDAEVRQKKLLQYRAEFDSVSGIFNKTAFIEETKKMLLAKPDKPHLLLRFDIDRFKIVNELYSISEGDKLLRHIGNVLRELARPGETYARMGDDIFCMCLERPEQEALQLVDRLEQRINNYPMAFQFLLSVGILRLSHYDGQPINTLCDRAALAQRTVKGSYVKRYAFYEDWMGEALNREHQITGYMRQALDSGQFKLYFQPEFDIRSHWIVGAEVLARWVHPTEGMIMPGDFIPLFERNGFIMRLDEYIWEKTCQYIRKWVDEGLDPVPVSVNVSRIHLYDPSICDKVLSLSEKYRLEPLYMKMEITESAYIESPQTLYGIMERLQARGYSFLMDDFGSGFSSLNVLKDIPVDMIKIDLNFLKDARQGRETSRNVLQGTIRLIQDLGLPIIVEGVETKEQADDLISMGCTNAQGYYFARPMPAEDFEELLRKRKADMAAFE